MKTILINIIIKCTYVLILLLPAACSLDENPETSRSASDYYTSKEECEVAVKGMYAAAQWIYKTNFLELVELPTDYARTTKTNEQKNSSLALFQYNAQHTSILGFYSDAFAAINRFNNVIRNLEKVDFLKDADKNRMLGEARFLRGLHYLNLVRVYGELPVKLSETLESATMSYPKWTNERIFKEAIIPDLTFAEQNLPFDAFESHRASGVAAKALLARAYLWLASCGKNGVMYHQWVTDQNLVTEYTDSVKAKCEAIIGNTKYGLYPAFYDVWLYDYKISKNSVIEHLFAINFEYDNAEGNSYGAWFHNYYGSAAPGWDLTPGRAPICLGQGFNGMAPTKEFWQMINSNPYDKRDTTMFTLRHGSTTKKLAFDAAGGASDILNTTGGASDMNSGINFGIVKYRFQKGLETSATGSAQVSVIRYADVLLMYAEACGHTDFKGISALEQVRKRAYEKPDYSLSLDDPADLVSEEAYEEAILKERKIELCFEMNRWFDMVRTHTLGSTMSDLKMMYNMADGVQLINMSDYFDDENKRMFFPLPSRALELNKGLEQNDPWK